MPPWQWAVLAGLVVAGFDAAAHLAAFNQYSEEILGYISMLDLWLSILIFYVLGMVSSRARGEAKAGAEMGAIAGVIAGLIDVAIAIWLPVPSDTPLVNQLVGVLSQNLFLGGVLGWLAGWFSLRQQPKPPR